MCLPPAVFAAVFFSFLYAPAYIQLPAPLLIHLTVRVTDCMYHFVPFIHQKQCRNVFINGKTAQKVSRICQLFPKQTLSDNVRATNQFLARLIGFHLMEMVLRRTTLTHKTPQQQNV